MPMTVKHMFGALACSAAVAMLAACGVKPEAQTVDPSATLKQPVEIPPTAITFAGPMTATTVIPMSNATVMSDGPVANMTACEARAKEVTYLYTTHAYFHAKTTTSCINPETGKAVIRFGCAKSETGAIACKPV